MSNWPRPWGGGEIDIVNICVISLVFIFNLINQISLNRSITDRIIYTLPFLVMIILIIMWRKNKILQAAIFLIIALGTTIDPANITDYSGSIFFIYSFHLVKNKMYSVFILISTISCITVRSIMAGDTIPQSLILIAVFGYIYAIYYFLIYKEIEKPITKKLSSLTKEENELLQKMCDGKPQGLAGSELGHTNKQETSKMISKIRDKLYVDDSQSTDKVIYLFTKYGK